VSGICGTPTRTGIIDFALAILGVELLADCRNTKICAEETLEALCYVDFLDNDSTKCEEILVVIVELSVIAKRQERATNRLANLRIASVMYLHSHRPHRTLQLLQKIWVEYYLVNQSLHLGIIKADAVGILFVID
jgi:hypothetical protein